MATSDEAYIYTGPWINYSDGRIFGARITLSSRSGGLLTAFLAVFVGLTGSCFWSILSYLYHQIKAGEGMKDGLHHQQQAILRNSGGPSSTAWQLLRLCWSWRNLAARPVWRSLPLIFTAALNVAVFGVASIYSSEVTKAAGNETLIIGPTCGYWIPDAKADEVTRSSGFRAITLSDTIQADSYARACYNKTHNVLQCNQFITRQIHWSVNANASCPFDEGRCRVGETGAYEMDTGPVDSHWVLGINAPEKDRVTIRRKTTCAPIYARDWIKIENFTEGDQGFEGDRFIRYYMGKSGDDTVTQNWTYQYNARSWVGRYYYTLDDRSTKTIWKPVPELNRTDADVSLHFLSSNHIQYYSPVYDPWFDAADPVDFDGMTLYWPVTDVRVMACIEQSQICSATDPNVCSPLGTSDQVNEWVHKTLVNADPLPMTLPQFSTASRLVVALNQAGISDTNSGRGGGTLLAQDQISEGFGQSLPGNQWQLEVSHWMGISLARFQQYVVSYAAGPSHLPPGTKISSPQEPIGQSFCRRQKVRHTGDHVSFSVFGMSVILALGGVIILLSLVIDTIGGWLQQLFRTGTHRRLEWIVDEKLQLLRLATDRDDIIWHGATDVVPRTQPGQLFGLADDVHHPRIVPTSARMMPAVSPGTPGAEISPFLPLAGQEQGVEKKMADAHVTEIPLS